MGSVCPKQSKETHERFINEEQRRLSTSSKVLRTTMPQQNINPTNINTLEGDEQRPDDPDDALVCIMARKKNKKISISDFTMIQVLGKGSFGKVVLVEKIDSKELYAMKMLKKDYIQNTNQKFNTQQERDILVKMDCSFIVRLHYAFQSKYKLYIVMDFMIGGELFFMLRRQPIFSEDKAAFYSAEIVLGIEALHSSDIVYRDLKPENILIDENGHLKLADFGLSKKGIKDDQRTNSLCGTPEYLAPEILLNNGHTKMVDLWSLGAIIYEMLTGAPPFYNRNQKQMFKDRFLKPIEMKEWFSAATRSVLLGFLNINPEIRLGINGMQEVKDHPFYTNIDWAKLAKRQLNPPFKPQVANKYDLKYFSKQFTSETVRDTPYVGKTFKDSYNEFTYQRQDLQLSRLGGDPNMSRTEDPKSNNVSMVNQNHQHHSPNGSASRQDSSPLGRAFTASPQQKKQAE